MLQTGFIRDNRDEVIRRLKIKNFTNSDAIDRIIGLDNKRRETQKSLDDNLSQANSIAREIGKLYKEDKGAEAELLKGKTASFRKVSKELTALLEKITVEMDKLLIEVPNLPHESVPPGAGETDNEIVWQEGDTAIHKPDMLPHWELAARYNIIDFNLGSKITGAGFPFYLGKGARLQRALINFFLDEAMKAGYNECQPPLFVNEESAYSTGQLPDKEGQMYHIGIDNLYPVPTAEVPVTNIYRDVILRPDEMPVRIVAYSSCFRREAGSYGKEVRGLNRLHQFDKVEIVQISHPAHSYEALEEMKDYVAGLVRKLELPFRIVKLCGGDLSFTSALTYDFEVFSAGQQKWLEVSSVSNFESFQANRMKLRFRDTNGKTTLAHTLNGSALALPRIVAALLENNQTGKGIKVPGVLVPYTGFDLMD